jgi:hypothetical protein
MREREREADHSPPSSIQARKRDLYWMFQNEFYNFENLYKFIQKTSTVFDLS